MSMSVPASDILTPDGLLRRVRIVAWRGGLCVYRQRDRRGVHVARTLRQADVLGWRPSEPVKPVRCR